MLMIYSRLTVISLSTIDVVGQTFNASLILACGIYPTADHAPITVPFDFDPKFKFLNSIDAELKEISRFTAQSLEITYEISGTFSQVFHLQKFPFDIQSFEICLSTGHATNITWDKNALTVLLVPASEAPVGHEWSIGSSLIFMKDNFRLGNVWDFQDTQSIASRSDAASSATGKIYCQIKYSIILKRLPSYHVWNILVPTFSICSLSFLAFCFPPDNLSDRLSVALTLLLTAAAYKVFTAQILPAISYLTYADIYIQVSFTFVCIIAIENAVAFRIRNPTTQNNFDDICVIALLVIWAFFNVIVAYTIYLTSRTFQSCSNKVGDVGASKVSF